jgi:glutathione S-transferase
MIKVLGRLTSSNVQKVVWMLDLLGQAYEQENRGGAFGGTKTEDYLALNPNATVPTVITDEGAIWESNTILRYLANRHGAAHLYPAAPLARAMVDQWLDWQLGALAPALRPLYVGLVREQKPLSELGSHRQAVANLMLMLDQQLARQAHVALDHFTLADIAIAPIVHRWYALELAAPETAHLRRYYEQLSADPLFAKHVTAIKMS